MTIDPDEGESQGQESIFDVLLSTDYESAGDDEDEDEDDFEEIDDPVEGAQLEVLDQIEPTALLAAEEGRVLEDRSVSIDIQDVAEAVQQEVCAYLAWDK